MLVSISIYEDSHPCPADGGVNLTMLHTAGKEPQKLAERYAASAHLTPNYQFKAFHSDPNC
jgi:hypothetical protein